MSKRSALVFTRIAASAAVATFVSITCATAKPITTTADTNLRKAAGTNSEVLTLIPKGTTVEVGKCSNGWCQTSLDGKDGYVIAQNLGMASARRAPRGPIPEDEEIVDEGYVSGPAYVAGPPVYYGYGPYYGYGGWGGWGYRGGWGRRW